MRSVALWAAVMCFCSPAAASGAVPALNNSDLTQIADGRFVSWDAMGSYAVDGQTARVHCESPSDASGLVQVIHCVPPIDEPFTASARAKAMDVGVGGDFAVWVDLIHTDGSASWGHVVEFSRGTHDWELARVDMVPAKPVAQVRFHLLLRHTTGQAWFAEPRLARTPVVFTRLRAVAGLWGADSLSIRAETNMPCLVRFEGLSPLPSTQPATDASSMFQWELDCGAAAARAERIEIEARAAHDPGNGLRVKLPFESVDSVGSIESAPRGELSSGSVNWRAWLEPITTRVFPDMMPSFSAPPINLDVVRDGHASVQVAVAANPHRTDQLLDVVMSDFIMDDAAGGSSVKLPGSLWSRSRMGFVRNQKTAAHPHLEHAGPTWWPDPLLSWRPLSIPRGQVRCAVLSVRIPRDQPAGVYKGFVQVAPSPADASGRSERLPVRLCVRDITLTERPRIKTAFALMDGFLEKVYGTISPQLRRAYTAFVLDHRLNPDDISRTRLPDPDELSWAKDHGLNAFNVLNLVPEPTTAVTWVCFVPPEDYTPAFKQRLIERLDAFVPELEKRGLLDDAYIYGFDERGEEYLPIMREYFGLIKQRYPRIKTLSTCWPPAGTDPASLHIDWYCPLSSKYDPAEAARVRSHGGQMWWYICMGPSWPYANWMLEYPLIEARLIWWQTWQQKVDGFLYWGLNIWDRAHNDKPIPDDSDVLLDFSVTSHERLHGDGVLLYPGQHGPLGSLRLLGIRDGMEDAMLLDAAVNKLGRKRVEQIARQVSRGMTDFTRDPAVLLEARRTILNEMESLSGEQRTIGRCFGRPLRAADH